MMDDDKSINQFLELMLQQIQDICQVFTVY